MKRLYRSEDEKMIAGVLGGLAEYFNVDPTLIRLLFVVSLFISIGTSFFAYVFAMFIMPHEREIR